MNAELLELFEADRREHKMGFRAGTAEYDAMRERDRDRRLRVQWMVDAGVLDVPEEFYQAAQIFQHGDFLEEAWTAHQLALRAAKGGFRPARWLAAAALDRWLVYQGKPQKYGTQYFTDGKHQHLFDVEPDTTDEERADWDVPPLQEQLRKADEAARNHPPMPIPPDPPGWLRDAIRRKLIEEGGLSD